MLWSWSKLYQPLGPYGGYMLELNATFGYLYVVSTNGPLRTGPFGFVYLYGKNKMFMWTYMGPSYE